MEDVMVEALSSIEDAISEIDDMPEVKAFCEKVFKKLEEVAEVLQEAFYAIDREDSDEDVMEHLKSVHWNGTTERIVREVGL